MGLQSLFPLTVLPLEASPFSVVIIVRAISLSRPLVGSSRTRTRGLVTNSVPTLSRLFCPPLMPFIPSVSLPMRVFAQSSKPYQNEHRTKSKSIYDHNCMPIWFAPQGHRNCSGQYALTEQWHKKEDRDLGPATIQTPLSWLFVDNVQETHIAYTKIRP